MEQKQLVETLNLAITEALANTHTATIAKITAVNETTINCLPVIARVVNGIEVPLPEFVEVPPLFMKGGDSYSAHPLAIGDYCIVLIMERCFDRWYDGTDFVAPAEFRMHDYSDAVALVGLGNKAGAITIPTVITHIGDTYQEGDYEHLGDREQTGDYTLTGNKTQTGDHTQTGDVDITGNIDASEDISAGGNVEADSYSVGGVAGWSGSFATGDARIVTVVNGLITLVA